MTAKKALLTAAGFASLGAGIVGIALPILPTTPFLLLSAICFSAGNSRFSNALMKNKYLAGYIDHYRNKTGIPFKIKMQSIAFLWAALLVSMFLLQKDYLFILLPCVGAGVTAHLALIQTKKE
jgi:uncharacterized protein